MDEARFRFWITIDKVMFSSFLLGVLVAVVLVGSFSVGWNAVLEATRAVVDATDTVNGPKIAGTNSIWMRPGGAESDDELQWQVKRCLHYIKGEKNEG